MNQLEEYILRKGDFILLISGLSGSKKSVLAKDMKKDLNFKLLNLDDYCDEEKVPIIEIFDQKVKDWDDIVSYDWDKFNNDVNNNKKNGCVVYGDSFPKNKIKFDTDFHIHITISKEKLIEKRKDFIEKNAEKCKDMIFFLDKLGGFINKVTYNHYIKNRQDSKINLWLNSDEDTIDKMADKTFEFIMNETKKFLDEYYSVHKRNVNFIKEDKLKNIKNIKNDDSDSSSEGTSITSSDSDDSTVDESSDSTDFEPVEEIDEIDKVYNEENKGAVSLGKYNDLLMEAQYWH